MKYIWLVASREFAENVRTKGFWIGVLLFPVILWASITVPKFLAEKVVPARHFVLVDPGGQFRPAIEQAIEQHHVRRVMQKLGEYAQNHSTSKRSAPTARDLENAPAIDMEAAQKEMLEGLLDAHAEAIDRFVAAGGVETTIAQLKSNGVIPADAPAFQPPSRQLVLVDPLPQGIDPNAPTDSVVESLKPLLLGERKIAVDGADVELFAAVLVPAGAEKRIKRPDQPMSMLPSDAAKGVQYWSINLTDNELKRTVENAINQEIRKRAFEAEDLDVATVKRIQASRIEFDELNPKKAAGDERVSMADTLRQWAPIGFVYLLFVALMTVSQMLLNNTVEEKSNRIIEVLLSSVTPGELMTGKLLGIAGVGFLMLLTWIVSIIAVLQFMAGPEVQWASTLFEVVQSSGLLWYFVIYFLLGYLLYAGIFLAIGSVCSTIKEAQNFMGPIMLIMMVPMLTMVFIPKDPHGTLATALTWIPLYTPFVMMNRAAADPPMFDLIGSGILLIVAIVLVLLACGKIFRLAILRTGQPPKLLEMFRWLRT